ncbi:hypothetical protein D3C75_814000 [compost metagenome]
MGLHSEGPPHQTLQLGSLRPEAEAVGAGADNVEGAGLCSLLSCIPLLPFRRQSQLPGQNSQRLLHTVAGIFMKAALAEGHHRHLRVQPAQLLGQGAQIRPDNLGNGGREQENGLGRILFHNTPHCIQQPVC